MKMFSSTLFCGKTTALFVAALALLGTGKLGAQTALTGSGDHLALPGITTLTGAVGPTNSWNGSLSFTTTWDSSAATAWIGPVNGTGPLPITSAGTSSGTSTYNFTTLTAGFLPANSYFTLGDLDKSEHITLTAYNTSNVLITSTWLNIPYLTFGGGGSGSGGVASANEMPGWDWNVTTASSYYFRGDTVVGNPSIALAMFNNVNIGYLVVNRDDASMNFVILAPSAVPEPSTYAVFAGLGALGFAAWRRRSRKNSPAGAPSIATV